MPFWATYRKVFHSSRRFAWSSLAASSAGSHGNPQTLYNLMFVVPKPNGKWRMILDLRRLNDHVSKKTFKMENVKEALRILRVGDFLSKVDLAHAFYHVALHPSSRDLTRFYFDGRNYRYRALPMGFSESTRIFSKLVKLAIDRARMEGIRLVFYVDDILILARSEMESRAHTTRVIEILEHLGFSIQPGKCQLDPKNTVIFLGMELHSKDMMIRLPRDKIRTIRKDAHALIRAYRAKEKVRVRVVASFLGKLSAAVLAMPEARDGAPNMQAWKTIHIARGGWEARARLNEASFQDLCRWCENLRG